MLYDYCIFSVTRRSRSDVRQSVSQSVTDSADRDFTDVTLVSDDINCFISFTSLIFQRLTFITRHLDLDLSHISKVFSRYHHSPGSHQ